MVDSILLHFQQMKTNDTILIQTSISNTTIDIHFSFKVLFLKPKHQFLLNWDHCFFCFKQRTTTTTTTTTTTITITTRCCHVSTVISVLFHFRGEILNVVSIWNCVKKDTKEERKIRNNLMTKKMMQKREGRYGTTREYTTKDL